jgi:hypothetical protein
MLRSHLDDHAVGPPPEVLDEVAAAWERAQGPLYGAFELHFELDPLLHAVRGELRLPDGNRAVRLSASEALAVACGDRLQPALAV